MCWKFRMYILLWWVWGQAQRCYSLCHDISKGQKAQWRAFWEAIVLSISEGLKNAGEWVCLCMWQSRSWRATSLPFASTLVHNVPWINSWVRQPSPNLNPLLPFSVFIIHVCSWAHSQLMLHIDTTKNLPFLFTSQFLDFLLLIEEGKDRVMTALE